MTTIIASIALALALYFTASFINRVAIRFIERDAMEGTTMHAIIACSFWGLFYYCTHIQP